MNQPNLSKSIRELEDDIGIAIFDRTAKGVVPTEKGRESSVTRNILSQIAEMEALYKPTDDKKTRFDLCAPRALYFAGAHRGDSSLLPGCGLQHRLSRGGRHAHD
ncbi:MAG: LysR family transcriptional regulator [Eubacteriales bacterium]